MTIEPQELVVGEIRIISVIGPDGGRINFPVRMSGPAEELNTDING
jgi:hypothetical protein